MSIADRPMVIPLEPSKGTSMMGEPLARGWTILAIPCLDTPAASGVQLKQSMRAAVIPPTDAERAQ